MRLSYSRGTFFVKENVEKRNSQHGRIKRALRYLPYAHAAQAASEINFRYAHDRRSYKFTAKEQDEEIGLYYYGARYLDAKYSRWMSADLAVGEYIPQAGSDNGKLPNGGMYNYTNLSLYHYSNNDPIKYTDPDGNVAVLGAVIVWGFNAALFGYSMVASRNDEAGFAARHPFIAMQLGGRPKDGGRYGINSTASNFAINSGLSKYAFSGATSDLGSKKGSYRHTVWQAIICSMFGEDIATQVGNSHDPITPPKQSFYTSFIDADTYCDQMNNAIGRKLGKNSNLSNKELALKTLDLFHETGLYTVSKNEDGTYNVGLTKIGDSEYYNAYSVLCTKNNQGLSE